MSDEKSISKDGSGLRYDNGKLPIDLIPFDALLVLAAVYEQGTEKYAVRNWEKGMAWSRMIKSLLRHFMYWALGEKYDSESGLPHLAHLVWNGLGLLTYEIRGMNDLDDRPLELQASLEAVMQIINDAKAHRENLKKMERK